MPEKPQDMFRGRGAQRRQPNRFETFKHEAREDFQEHLYRSGESQQTDTRYIPVHPKSIVNKVDSPDVGMSYSLNPYQGCEHGCIYCYARNSHEYWGYGAGVDFESRILVKSNAPELLRAHLSNPKWQASPIVLSGNTDCYQPAERKFGLTRSCLEVFLQYRHPVGIITKNAMVLRDLDLLRELHADGLVAVHVSVTSLREETRRILEPRTASVSRRLKTIQTLADAGIPVHAMLAPIIPGLNSDEIFDMARAVADCGARGFSYTVVRLNGALGAIFTDWIRKKLPDKAAKVLSQIRACHGGQLNDSRFGIRNKGEGPLSSQIQQMAALAKRRYFAGRGMPPLNTQLHETYKTRQWKLF